MSDTVDEAALRESEHKFRHLFETMAQGVVYQDREGRIISANPAAERILGISLDQMMGKTSSDATWNAIREDGTSLSGSEHPAMIALRTGNPFGPFVMGVFQSKKNTRTWLSVTAIPLFRPGERTPFQVYATFDDITQRKQAEEDLRRTRNYLGKLMQYANAPIIVWDPDLRIARFNAASERMTGFSTREVLGRHLSMLFPEASREASMALIHETLAGTFWETVEIPIRRKNGEIRLAVWNSANILDEDNATVIATIASGEDITDRRQAEEKIRTLLQEKELLLAEVHHRVKNNLNAIASLLSLQTRRVTCEEAKTALKDAESRVLSMLVLYSKLFRSGSYGRISLAEYLEPLARDIVGMFPNGNAIRVETHFDDTTISTKTALPLGIIVNELITNAMKHAFFGREEGRIAISSTRDENMVSLMLRDNGKGMPENVDFETSPGFGLEVVRLLTRQISGTIRMERGAGTKFTISFPVNEG